MSTLNVDKVDPNTGTALEIGSSGDTVTVPSGATLTLTSATLNLPTTITSTTEVKTNKISPATGVAFALGDSGDTFTVPSGATIVNSGTATGFGITATSFRPIAQPIAYNGDMQVSQRTTSETGITDNRYSACDRYKIEIDSCGTWTVAQETLSSGNAYDDGFRKALRLDCTTADASPAAADAVIVSHRFEGQDLNAFKKGTSNAQPYTLAFWIKSNKTGTAQVNFNDEENTRLCSGTYTISSGDTWEKKIINIAADTSGASNNDNTESIRISWWFDAGSNYTGGTVPTAWEATNASDQGVETLSLADSTSNDVAITGVQLEVGTYTSATIPPFQHETFGDNLARCKRYYQKSYNYDEYGGTNTGSDAFVSPGALGANTTSYIWDRAEYPVDMRTPPTLSLWDMEGNSGMTTRDNWGTANSPNQNGNITNKDSTKFIIVYSSGTYSANALIYQWTASAEL